MSILNQERVKALLSTVVDPLAGRDIVSLGWLRGIAVVDDKVAVDLRAPYPLGGQPGGRLEDMQARVRSTLEADAGISKATINLDWRVLAHKVQGELKPMPEIRNIIAVGSGKGGVGKSATSINLALALQADGAKVGVLDADIYGPSVPRMLGISGRPETDGKRIIPQRTHGLQVMSIGFMVEEDTPMIWRGPMVTSALQQLLTETNWENLDYLVIDLPPGTGDIQLTLAQKVPVSACVVVTTPQDIALLDARKAVQMFRKVDMTVLGVVENMSTHICSQCGHEEAIFGSGGGASMSADFNLPLLGQLPLAMRIRADLDAGNPTVVAAPDSEITASYIECARRIAIELSQRPRSLDLNLPTIQLQNR
jgi:ATP-binding protein involved in chromosome partitioning